MYYLCLLGIYELEVSCDIPQSAHTASKGKLLRMDRCGPKHVELTPEY